MLKNSPEEKPLPKLFELCKKEESVIFNIHLFKEEYMTRTGINQTKNSIDNLLLAILSAYDVEFLKLEEKQQISMIKRIKDTLLLNLNERTMETIFSLYNSKKSVSERNYFII